MRHNRRTRERLGRTHSERKALVENLVSSLLRHQEIKTTLQKAKAARSLAERLITLGKKDTLAARRRVFSYLQDHTLTSKVFKEVAPRFKDRVGGYTRILHLQRRKGDGADLALLELTEKEIIVKEPPKGKAKKQDRADEHKGHAHPHPAEGQAKGPVKAEAHESKREEPKKDQPKKGFFRNISKFFRNKGGS
ncbi:MAG: 50S ribosomal protein L17 [Candidatus Omnitrophica bacterium]|nr:50S ribosomal protein L17 [Candidatus Omnitrophota bacterium]